MCSILANWQKKMLRRKLFIILSNEYDQNTKITVDAKILKHHKINGKLTLAFYDFEFESKEKCIIKLVNEANSDSISKNLYCSINNCICFPKIDKKDLIHFDWFDFSIEDDTLIDVFFKFITLNHCWNRYYIENQEKYDILSTFIYLIRNLRENGVFPELEQMFSYSKQILSFLFRIAQIDDDKIKESRVSIAFIKHFIDSFLNDLYHASLFGPYTCILYFWNYFVCNDKTAEGLNYNRNKYVIKRNYMSFLFSDATNINRGYYMKNENFEFIESFYEFGFREVLILCYFNYYDHDFYDLNTKLKNFPVILQKDNAIFKGAKQHNAQDLFIEKLKGYEQSLINRDPFFNNIHDINEDVCYPFVNFCIHIYPEFFKDKSLFNLSLILNDNGSLSNDVNQYLFSICSCVSKLVDIQLPDLEVETKIEEKPIFTFWVDDDTPHDEFDQLYLESRGFFSENDIINDEKHKYSDDIAKNLLAKAKHITQVNKTHPQSKK